MPAVEEAPDDTYTRTSKLLYEMLSKIWLLVASALSSCLFTLGHGDTDKKCFLDTILSYKFPLSITIMQVHKGVIVF